MNDGNGMKMMITANIEFVIIFFYLSFIFFSLQSCFRQDQPFPVKFVISNEAIFGCFWHFLLFRHRILFLNFKSLFLFVFKKNCVSSCKFKLELPRQWFLTFFLLGTYLKFWNSLYGPLKCPNELLLLMKTKQVIYPSFVTSKDQGAYFLNFLEILHLYFFKYHTTIFNHIKYEKIIYFKKWIYFRGKIFFRLNFHEVDVNWWYEIEVRKQPKEKQFRNTGLPISVNPIKINISQIYRKITLLLKAWPLSDN